MNKVVFSLIAAFVAYVVIMENDAVMKILGRAGFGVLLILMSAVIYGGGYLVTVCSLWLVPERLREKHKDTICNVLPLGFVIAFWSYGWFKMNP